MVHNPKLSIILPVYRMEEYIVRCLTSIYLNPEAYNSIEVLIVNDGTPDKSIEIANDWIAANGISNIRIINQENKGLGGARNVGIKNANAPFIWMVDPDDEIYPDAIRYILTRLDPSLDFITFNAKYLPSGSNVYNYPEDIPAVDSEILTSEITINSPCFNMFNVDFLKRNNLFFKEKFHHEDNEFAIRANFYAKKIAFYNKAVYKYYISHNLSITHVYSRKRIDNLLSHFDTYDALMTQKPSKLQIKAMHRINHDVAYHWLNRSMHQSDKPLRDYARRLVLRNRLRIFNAISKYSIRNTMKFLISTSPLFISLNSRRKLWRI